MRIRRHIRRWQDNDSTAKYGLMAAITLLSVGWQLQAAIPAAADQAPASVDDPRPVVSLAKGEVSADDAVQPTTDDETQEKPLKQAKTALTPDTTVDQPAIARTVARATQSAVTPEINHQQQTTPVPNETAVQPTDPVTTPAAVGPVPAITDDELPTTPVQAYTNETIDQWMPNQILRKAVWLALQDTHPKDGKTWATPEEITQQDMQRLEALRITGNQESHGINSYIDGKTEFSLKGLAYAVNLKIISLGAGLNSELDTSKPFQIHGDVVDISPLAYMPELEYAALDNNRITDISPLRHLQQLDRLYLTFNHIADFSPLMDHEFRELTITRQLVTLPAIKVDAQTRRAQIASPYIQPNDPWAVAGLGTMATNWLRQNISFQLTETGHSWNFVRYHTMPGTDIDMGVTDDDWDVLYFKNIPDQLPGDYGGLQVNEFSRQIALPDYYYLVGQAYPDTTEFKTTDGDIEWYVVQPYTIAQEAGTITVHYQDQAGQTLAPDQTLPQGDVGDSYDTSQLAVTIKGYTLMTPPDNAVGTYTAAPISVTYVYRKDLVKPDTTRPPVPEVPGVRPPAEVIPPEITPPNPVTPPEITPPVVTEPTEVVLPETPPTVVLPVPTSLGDADGISESLNSDQQSPQQPGLSRPLPSQSLSLPQTNDQQSSSWWGVALLAITTVGGWLGKRRWSK
ncbi:MucBP domain-containing protein [Levilactobacillus yiduensis]|uniref:MucBP domain-containing protein n=1 Tax=Levilactobacillus yiduensis TaxID=2953880 RepID=UPI000EF29A59|nr:MucBP domain-containing protein [Levilactobacillus yiduensis]AYM01927.1 hypothetical protein D8911_02555 [Levilactobacillus brevis]